MKEGPRRFPALLAVLGAATFFSGIALTYAELAPPLELSTSVAGRFQVFLTQQAALPVAEASKAEQIQECHEVAKSVFARAQPRGRRESLFEACNAIALETVSAAPTMAVAWAVAASTAVELGRVDAFNANLLASIKVAPQEQWLAKVRVDLIEDNFAIAGDALRAAETGQIKVLVQSRLGIGGMAQRYINEPDFRERVTSAVETLPADDQRRFLSEVGAAARAQGVRNAR